MKNIKLNQKSFEKDVKDVFGAYLLHDAQFEGYYDMPVIDVRLDIEIKEMIPYSEITSIKTKNGFFCHFYEFDYRFDGRDGVWNSLIQCNDFKRGFNLDKLEGLSGIISPDYSLYMDMPRCMQIWNIYRSRTVCYYLNKIGYLCIPNVRWTDEESYKYAFDGLAKGCAVAVGTLGCSKDDFDKRLFLEGFKQMLQVVEPSAVIIYGSLTKEIKKELDIRKVRYYYFPSKISRVMKEVQNGNES